MGKRAVVGWIRISFLAYMSIAAATAVAGQSTCEAPGSLRETLRVGSLDGGDALSGILDFTVGPNGDLNLAQQFVPHVAVFTSEGLVKGTIGRAGNGPGEFDLSPIRLGWLRDTLWVTDRSSTQFFDPDGNAVRQSDWRILVPEEASLLVPGPPLADGTFLARRIATTAGGADMADMFGAARHAVTRISGAGEILDTIVFVRPKMSVAIETSWGGVGFAEHPLAGSWRGFDELTATPDGSSILIPGEIDIRAGAFDILRIGTAGDTLLKLTIPYKPRPITARDRRWLTEEFGKVHAGDYRAAGSSAFSKTDLTRERDRRAAEGSITFPDHFPPVRQIIGGQDGSIWLLRELDPSALADLWEVYGAEGEFVGSVMVSAGRSAVLPWEPRLDVLRVTLTEVWGSTLGEFDEPYLHRYDVLWACR
jgi:hypothetical protein